MLSNRDFKLFSQPVNQQLQAMVSIGLYQSAVPADMLWETYINAFPEGTNNVYRVNREYECTCCKQFVRAVGGAVAIGSDNKVITIWDIHTEDPVFGAVAKTMAALVRKYLIDKPYSYVQTKIGAQVTVQTLLTQEQALSTLSWNHFYFDLPRQYVATDATATALGEERSTQQVFLRGLEEITFDAIQMVLELISQNSLYRGAESKKVVEWLLDRKTQFSKLPADDAMVKDCYAWRASKANASFARIRNTAIGTLLTELSTGMDLETAVSRFEKMVAPTNYRRPTALITKGMVEQARKQIAELGIQDAMYRRHATLTDVTVNHVLFQDASSEAVAPSSDPLDVLAGSVKAKPQVLDKVEEISIDDFVGKVLPLASSVELYLGNNLSRNMVSLIAPQNPSAPNLFKWNNPFSWSYVGEIADSITERVKAAGGSTEGNLRVSLSWENTDDLDVHVYVLTKTRTGGEKMLDHIFYNNRQGTYTRGLLDVDANSPYSKHTKTPVENIIFSGGADKLEGLIFRVEVSQYCRRSLAKDSQGFTVQVAHVTGTREFSQSDSPREGSTAKVVEFAINNGMLEYKDGGSAKQLSKDIWGLPSEAFHKVETLMTSPNFWGTPGIGNKHWFFFLKDCVNPDSSRGFYNEFLRGDLDKHRKVFEVLGSQMAVPAVPEASKQLSGVGFSVTQRNEAIVRVTGKVTRLLRVKF